MTTDQNLAAIEAAGTTPPEATDDKHHTVEHGADRNLDAALYDLRRTGADAGCIATIERVLGQLTEARRIVAAA